MGFCRQFGIDTLVGLIQSFVLRTNQAIQHTPDFPGFRPQFDGSPNET
jgi:hypothetical protein